MEELKEAIRNHFAMVSELRGASIGLADPVKLQKHTQSMNRLSTAIQTAKQDTDLSGEEGELVSMQIASDINAILKKQ